MITREEVRHIAKLARLKLTEEEEKSFQKELSSILDYFNLLKEVDVKSSLLTQEKNGLIENVVREDKIKKQSPKSADALLKAAPEEEKKHIKVKAVL